MKKLALPVTLLVLADQLTKYLVRANLYPGEGRIIAPFLNLVYATNTGVAFSLFQGGNTFFLVFNIAAVAAFLVWFSRHPGQLKGVSRTAVLLILAGAVGNIIDRILHGHVIDFIDVYFGSYHWPSFNLADSYISVGGILLFIALCLPERKTAAGN